MQFIDYKVKKATKKACNTSVSPPKPKHVRTIILKSFQGGIPTFYTELSKTIQSANPIQQYKSLVTLHRVIREGSPHLFGGYLTSFLNILNRVVGTPSHLSSYYVFQQISRHYMKYLQIRFVFHQKYKIFTGSLTINQKEPIPERYYSDQVCLLTLSNMMDLMDYLTVIPAPVIENYWGDNCKMDCTIPLILDSYDLYTSIVIFMRNLAHVEQNKSVFIFLVNRFKRIFGTLNKLYNLARKSNYITSLIDVPVLPSQIPGFEVTIEEKEKYIRSHPHAITKQPDKSYKAQKELFELQNRKVAIKKPTISPTELQQLNSVTKDFCSIFSSLLNGLTPPETTTDDNESKLERMACCLLEELSSINETTPVEEIKEFKDHLWKTFIGSQYLFGQRNINFAKQNKSEEAVISTLLEYQELVEPIQEICLKEDGISDLLGSIENFIQGLTDYGTDETSETVKAIENKPNKYQDLYDVAQLNEFEMNNPFESNSSIPKQNNQSSQNSQNQTSYTASIEPISPTKNLISFSPEPNDIINQNTTNKGNESQENMEMLNQHDYDGEIHKVSELHQRLNEQKIIKEKNNEPQHEIDLIDETSNTTDSLQKLLRIASLCENERIKEGNSTNGNYYEQQTGKSSNMWKDGLFSAAQTIVSNSLYLGDIFKSVCSQLVVAARVSMRPDSKLLNRLEEALTEVMTTSQNVIHVIKEKQKEKKFIVEEKGLKGKTQLMESKIRILKLQKELEEAQNEMYQLRKEEYGK
ncbi:ENTH domain protein [Entamoeba marina]